MECSIPNRYDTVLPTLSPTDENGPVINIDIVKL